MACKNGHIDTVKLLLKNGANPFLLSMVEKSEYESVLEVSGRWSHKRVLLYLLDKIEWRKEDL